MRVPGEELSGETRANGNRVDGLATPIASIDERMARVETLSWESLPPHIRMESPRTPIDLRRAHRAPGSCSDPNDAVHGPHLRPRVISDVKAIRRPEAFTET